MYVYLCLYKSKKRTSEWRLAAGFNAVLYTYVYGCTTLERCHD